MNLLARDRGTLGASGTATRPVGDINGALRPGPGVPEPLLDTANAIPIAIGKGLAHPAQGRCTRWPPHPRAFVRAPAEAPDRSQRGALG